MSQSQQTQSNSTAIELLNSLLRGEISAAETYKQALDTAKDQSVAAQLRRIQQQHGNAVYRLTAHIRRLDGEPSTDSGIWGIWAKAVQGTAKLLGTTSAIQALQTGEGHGLDQYHSALNSGALPSDVESEVQKELIPQQQAHIETLGRLAAQA